LKSTWENNNLDYVTKLSDMGNLAKFTKTARLGSERITKLTAEERTIKIEKENIVNNNMTNFEEMISSKLINADMVK